MANPSGVWIIDANGWATSATIKASSILVVFSGDNGSVILHDRHGNVVFRADNGTSQRSIPVPMNQTFEGIRAQTWTNVAVVFIYK